MDPWNPGWFAPSENKAPPIQGTIGLADDPSAPNAGTSHRGRVSERVPVEVGAGLRRRGASGVSVHVTDLSTHGFRAETHLELGIGADVWLRLPGLEPCQAKVAWVRGYIVGCAFDRPLHPAVLAMIVSKSQDI